MKTNFFLLLLLLFSVQLTAQTNPPLVQIQQGEIIGDLPYGRYFFIEGSAVLPTGEIAEEVTVSIYKTGRTFLFHKKKIRTELSEEQRNQIIANNLPIERSTWALFRNPEAKSFKVYINTPLDFASEYIVSIDYSREYNFKFSDADKEAILRRVENITAEVFERNEVLTDDQTKNYLNLVVEGAMRDKVKASGNNFYGFSSSEGQIQIVTPPSLYTLSKDYLNIIGPSIAFLEEAKKNLAAAKKALATAKTDDDKASAEFDIQTAEGDTATYQSLITELRAQQSDKLQIINRQLAKIYVEHPAGSTKPSAVAEVDAVRIGTAIGGGGIFFNPQNADVREVNALAYTALKFYLLPVDKRVADPYLSGIPFFNRTSILFGVITSNSFEYRGQALEKPIGLAPLAGISFDVNRYFSLDLGTTVFRQPSVSALSSLKKTRFAPVLGINFDFDAFNRIKSLTNGQGPYNVNITGN